MIFSALWCVWFVLQTLHKPYTEPYIATKETKRLKDKETKGERRKDRLFETLMFMNLIH